MVASAPQLHRVSTSENPRTISIDMSGSLDTGDTLTGTPTLTHSADLSTSSAQVSSGSLSINGVSVSAGEAVQFSLDPSGGTVGTVYTVSIVCSTVAGDVVEGEIDIKVV